MYHVYTCVYTSVTVTMKGALHAPSLIGELTFSAVASGTRLAAEAGGSVLAGLGQTVVHQKLAPLALIT